MLLLLIAIGDGEGLVARVWLDAICLFDPWDSEVMTSDEIAWCNN